MTSVREDAEGVTATGAPLVLVLVGTDHHPFDRLIGWVDQWLAARRGAAVDCIVQHGTSRPSRGGRSRPYLDHDHLDSLMSQAAVVVCHGGPSTITEARRHGHLPLVVPRSPAHGEHVDDHQQRFCRWIAEKGLVRHVTSATTLATTIEADLCAGSASGQVDPSPGGGGVQAAVRRFAALVDELVAERRR